MCMYICYSTLCIQYHVRFVPICLQTNTFQLVIASNGVRSFMIFLYGQLQWTTGDASGGSYGLGGTEAAVGLGAGDGVGHVTVIGSYAPEVLQVISISNVGILGVIVLSSGNTACNSWS